MYKTQDELKKLLEQYQKLKTTTSFVQEVSDRTNSDATLNEAQLGQLKEDIKKIAREEHGRVGLNPNAPSTISIAAWLNNCK